MRKKLVAGNWKMNGNFDSNSSLLDGLLQGMAALKCDVLVCVPFPYLNQAKEKLLGSAVSLGAQNLSQYTAGAYTGEVSASMLLDVGAAYVLVGHSERRALFGDSDAVVAAKCKVALEMGLIPVLCVGETLKERESGLTEQVVGRQLSAVLDVLVIKDFQRVVIAYEPVWAIGTGKTATPEQAQLVHAAIRAQLAALDALVADEVKILYGGSVKPQSAVELFVQPDIDGGLIGGAALVVDDFLAICQAAN
jgi:triosephosphate isomerase